MNLFYYFAEIAKLLKQQLELELLSRRRKKEMVIKIYMANTFIRIMVAVELLGISFTTELLNEIS